MREQQSLVSAPNIQKQSLRSAFLLKVRVYNMLISIRPPDGDIKLGSPLMVNSRLIPTAYFSITDLHFAIHYSYITAQYHFIELTERYEKCLWVSSSVKKKPLPALPSGESGQRLRRLTSASVVSG